MRRGLDWMNKVDPAPRSYQHLVAIRPVVPPRRDNPNRATPDRRLQSRSCSASQITAELDCRIEPLGSRRRLLRGAAPPRPCNWLSLCEARQSHARWGVSCLGLAPPASAGGADGLLTQSASLPICTACAVSHQAVELTVEKASHIVFTVACQGTEGRVARAILAGCPAGLPVMAAGGKLAGPGYKLRISRLYY